MLAILFSNPIAFIIIAGGLLIALTIHEFAHAFTADKLGDPTPRYQGRVTLDPRAHLDPLGTVAILLTRFGWGKPVQFDPYNLKEPKRDAALIALAGPVSNIILAILLGILININMLPLVVVAALEIILQINVMLAIFNLVPIHPLDGSKILMAFLPKETAFEYEQFMNRYGMFILILLIFPLFTPVSPVAMLISPIIEMIIEFLV